MRPIPFPTFVHGERGHAVTCGPPCRAALRPRDARVAGRVQGLSVGCRREYRKQESRDHDVIVGFCRVLACQGRDCSLETPADAIANHGVADLLGDGEAKSGPDNGPWPQSAASVRGLVSRTKARVAQRDPPRTRKNSVRVLSVTSGTGFTTLLSARKELRASRDERSGRKALAALGAAARQNLDAASGLHALAEAVAALAHEAARLIGAFHVRNSVNQPPRRPSGPADWCQREAQLIEWAGL